MRFLYSFISLAIFTITVAQGGSLRGTVRDATTLAPVAGASVTVHIHPDSVAMPTTTDQEGNYSITNIRPNNVIYDVVTLANGYVRLQTRIDNLGALDLVYDIFVSAGAEFPPVGGDSSSVFGTVMTPGSDSLFSIPSARVTINSQNQEFSTLTDSRGKYALHLPTNYYSVRIEADGYKSVTVTGINVASEGAMVDAILQHMASGITNTSRMPAGFALLDARPNPFNPSTIIGYVIPIPCRVRIQIFDVGGRLITTLVDHFEQPGKKSIQFDAVGLAGGVYFYRLDAGSFTETKTLVLLK